MFKLLKFLIFSLVISTTSFEGVYAGRTGQTKKEATQTRRVAVKQARRDADLFAQLPHADVHNTSISISHASINRALACMLIAGLIIQATNVQAGPLDGKITKCAELNEQAKQFHHELASKHPTITTCTELGAKIAAKAGIGAIIGSGVAGVGAIPGAAVGAGITIAQEAQSYAAGKIIHDVIGGETEVTINQAASKVGQGIGWVGAKVLTALDSKLDSKLAATFSSDLVKLGFAASDMGSFSKKMSSGLGDVLRDNLKLGKGLAYGAKHRMKDAFFDASATGAEVDIPQSFFTGDAFHSFYTSGVPYTFQQPSQRATPTVSDFVGDPKRFVEYQMYEDWKAESSSFHIPPVGNLHFPDARAISAADNAYLNEQASRRFIERAAQPMMPSILYVPTYNDFDDCIRWAEIIYNNKDSYYAYWVAEAKKLEPKIGALYFPPVPVLTGKCYNELSFDLDRNEKKRRNNAAIEEYKNFDSIFGKQVEKLHKLVNEYNAKVTMYNKALVLIKEVSGVVEKMHNPYPSVRKAFEVFSKKTYAEYFSQSCDDIELALTTLEIIKQELVDYEDRAYSDAVIGIDESKMKEKFLELFRGNARSITIARSILSKLAHGNFATEIKEWAQELLNLPDKKGIDEKMANYDLANSLAELITKALKTYGDYKYIFSQLDELGCGFLTAGASQPGIVKGQKQQRGHKTSDFLDRTTAQIVCTPKGICGIVDFWVKNFAVTKSDMEKAHQWFVSNDYPVTTAQSLLSFIRPGGKNIGKPYICEVDDASVGCDTQIADSGLLPVTTNVRSLDGGSREALAVFNFLAKNNTVRDGYDSQKDITYKKIVLSDKTKITFYPPSEKGESVIIISDIPHWILDEKIELRFPYQEPSARSILVEQFDAEKRQLQEEFSVEFEKFLSEQSENLTPEERTKLLDFHDEITSL